MTTTTILSDNGVSSGTAGIKTTGGNDGTLQLQTTTAGGAATTALTIDTSQNVGIGTSSPTQKLNLYSGAGLPCYSVFQGNANTDPLFVGQDSAGLSRFFLAGANPLTFWTSGTERARITPAGDFLVGATSIGAKGLSNIVDPNGIYSLWNVTANGFGALQFRQNGTGVGSVVINTTTVSYNTSSDYRLKENITPMTGALSVVQQLKPCTYSWKSDGSDGQGFIAHELQEVVPDCVTGKKDAVDANGDPVYQGIDTSFLVATLTAAIQEQQALITTLTERISALEAK
jgi:hypothetical protein